MQLAMVSDEDTMVQLAQTLVVTTKTSKLEDIIQCLAASHDQTAVQQAQTLIIVRQ